MQSTSSLAADSVCSDSETVYPEEQTHQLLDRIEGLHYDMISRRVTMTEEAKIELLGNSIKTCHRIFGGLFDEGIGKENGEELELKFVDICHDARMSVYTAEEKDKDGPSHKAASRWLESLYRIEKSLVHRFDHIILAPRGTQKEIGRRLKYEWNQHASSIIRDEDALISEAAKTDNKE